MYGSSLKAPTCLDLQTAQSVIGCLANPAACPWPMDQVAPFLTLPLCAGTCADPAMAATQLCQVPECVTAEQRELVDYCGQYGWGGPNPGWNSLCWLSDRLGTYPRWKAAPTCSQDADFTPGTEPDEITADFQPGTGTEPPADDYMEDDSTAPADADAGGDAADAGADAAADDTVETSTSGMSTAAWGGILLLVAAAGYGVYRATR